MNILLVSHSGEIGGAQNFLLYLAEGLKEHKVYCIMPSLNNGLSQKMEAVGVECSKMKLHQVEIRSSQQMIDYIKEKQIDLVITNTSTVFDGGIAAFHAAVRHIWCIHELGINFAVKSIINQYSSMIVAASNSIKRDLEIDRTEVVHIGIKPKANPNGVSFNNVVLTVGGMSRRKTQITLLKAAPRVLEEIPDAQFVSVGGTWERDYYDRFYLERKRLGISKEQFVHHKKTDDIDQYYEFANVYVQTSAVEPFGLSIIEAMNNGVPVVATRSGGPEEIIEDGVNGFLLYPDDHKRIADKILYLLKNPKEAERIGTAGWDRVKEEFTFDQYIEKFKKVIEEVCKSQS